MATNKINAESMRRAKWRNKIMKSNKIDLDCINHPDFDLFKTNYPVRSRDLFIGKDDYDFLEE